MSEFLNSKSMITPGIAGAVVTLVAGTLASQFGVPAKWTALAVSVLLALMVFFGDKVNKVSHRAVAFVLNALIIFSISVGANTSITSAKAPPKQPPPFETAPAPTPTPFFHDWFGN
jgi:purine-cytosine permease-like protein